MEHIHLTLAWSLDVASKDVLQKYGTIFGISILTAIEVQPGDESTDPGGFVSLAELGYKEVARNISIDEAKKIPLPLRPFCLAYVATRATYLSEIAIDQSDVNHARLKCIELRLGNHEVKGVMHSPEDINGWSVSRKKPNYSVIRANGSVAISGEGDGDYETLVEFVATHPRTKEIVTALKNWCGPLQIFT